MKRIVCFICFFVLVLPFNVSAVSTSASAAVVINADTNEVLYSHNADNKLSMASTTKIMTALLLCEAGDFEKEITVSAEMLRVEGSSMGLLAGDKVRPASSRDTESRGACSSSPSGSHCGASSRSPQGGC